MLNLKLANGNLLLILSQRPVNVTIKASLTRRDSVIKFVKQIRTAKHRLHNAAWKQN